MPSETITRDALMTDPRLVEIVTAETRRISVALKLDVVDSKEVYRSMVAVCIDVALAIAVPDGAQTANQRRGEG